MTITIPDDILRQAGLSEQQAVVEFACRLFDAGKLSLWPAARMAGLSRVEFEAELRSRGIGIYRITPDDVALEAEALRKLES